MIILYIFYYRISS